MEAESEKWTVEKTAVKEHERVRDYGLSGTISPGDSSPMVLVASPYRGTE